ncbi:MAG: class I SAM-dependent methyltransferase [Thermoplasmata archaeon]
MIAAWNEECFNIEPKKYDAWYETPFGRYAHRLEMKKILECLDSIHGKRILDLGCGTGVYSIVLAERKAGVVAVDSSLKMLVSASKKIRLDGDEVGIVLCRAEYLPFKDKSFDFVLSVTTLCYVDEVRRAIAEMWRVVKPTGRIVIGEINKLSAYGFQKRIMSKFKKSAYEGAKFYSLFELVQLFGGAEWISTVFGQDWMPEWLLRFMSRFEMFLSRRFGLFGSFIVLSITLTSRGRG